jgi:hypothetical protein
MDIDHFINFLQLHNAWILPDGVIVARILKKLDLNKMISVIFLTVLAKLESADFGQ